MIVASTFTLTMLRSKPGEPTPPERSAYLTGLH